EELLPHAQLALGAHRLDERLVAVAQVDAAPRRRRREHAVGPGAVGQRDRREGTVLRGSHRGHWPAPVSRRGAPEEPCEPSRIRTGSQMRETLSGGFGGRGFRGRWIERRALGLSRLRKEE